MAGMNDLQVMFRMLRPAPKPGRDHLTVFREFVHQLERVSKKNEARETRPARKDSGRKSRKR